MDLLRVEGLPIWQTTAVVPLSLSNVSPEISDMITWFIGGTLPDWESTPVVGIILVEGKDPELAQRAGQAILMKAIQPDIQTP